MTYVLNDATLFLAAPAVAREGKTVWQRLFAAMVESRRRSALREIRARQFLTNESELVLGGFPMASLNSDAKLPFNR